jgi:ATP/maltotriose-dependent transcriptional regulator MalT
MEAVLATLLNELNAVATEVVLALDDYHIRPLQPVNFRLGLAMPTA